ncbi:hypothetical protein K8R14_01500 [bacterium]|nr:hypothetical protein [bacterium]
MSIENSIPFKSVSIDVDAFEKGNDLTNDTFFHSTTQSGTFTISDGTEYGYHLASGLSIYKITGIDRPPIEY